MSFTSQSAEDAKYGTFNEGFDDFNAKSPPEYIVNNKALGYNENYKQLMLLGKDIRIDLT